MFIIHTMYLGYFNRLNIQMNRTLSADPAGGAGPTHTHEAVINTPLNPTNIPLNPPCWQSLPVVPYKYIQLFKLIMRA